jgi:putative DNA primase/helicase
MLPDGTIRRDAIQHSYNAWLREFGTGNKEHQQIIEQTDLNAHGLSRYAPTSQICLFEILPDTGKGKSRQRPDNFLHFPGSRGDKAGFNAKQFAEYEECRNACLQPAAEVISVNPRVSMGGNSTFTCSFMPESSQPEE